MHLVIRLQKFPILRKDFLLKLSLAVLFIEVLINFTSTIHVSLEFRYCACSSKAGSCSKIFNEGFVLIGFYIISFKTNNMWVGCQTQVVLMRFCYSEHQRTLISLSVDTIFIWWEFSVSSKLQRELVSTGISSHTFILVIYMKRQLE